MKKIRMFPAICLLLISTAAFSQHPTDVGAEYQLLKGRGYSGKTLGVRGETFDAKHSWSIGITKNLSSKSSYSEYRGIGLFFGYRHGFKYNTNGNGNLFAGGRLYLSFENFFGKESANGMSIMPAAEAGYEFLFWKQRIFTSPSIGYGYKIKMTKGNNSLQEDEGGRVIPSLSLGYHFH